MIRDALMKSIRPRVEELASDLVDLIATRFEGQLDQALDAARSALASDMESGAPQVYEAQPTVEPIAIAAETVEVAPTVVETPRKNIRVATVAAGTTTKGTPRKRAVIRCGTCGELGGRADTCGITHNLSTKPALPVAAAPTRRSTPAPASSPSPPKPDRFAAIEAAAQRRAEKEKRGPRDPDDDDRPRRDAEPDIASDVGLPEPTFSTDL